MDLKPQFNKDALRKAIIGQVQKMRTFAINEFKFIAENFVRTARINADFTDRTGNLRSSIGFLILLDGKSIYEDFEESAAGSDKATGKSKGLEYALEQVKGELGLVLIVVAGMEYAAAVESRGFDVLTSSSFEAEDEIKQSLVRIKRAFNQ